MCTNGAIPAMMPNMSNSIPKEPHPIFPGDGIIPKSICSAKGNGLKARYFVSAKLSLRMTNTTKTAVKVDAPRYNSMYVELQRKAFMTIVVMEPHVDSTMPE